MILALLAANVNAQTGNIDECDLQGTWKVTGMDGYLLQMDEKPEYFVLSGNQPGRIYKSGDDLFVIGWFISNNNKLHLMLSNNSWLNFVIEEYSKDDGYMKLKSFDNACIMLWSLMNYSSVPAINSDRKKDTPKYSIKGVKIDKPEGIYIQNGQKFIAK